MCGEVKMSRWIKILTFCVLYFHQPSMLSTSAAVEPLDKSSNISVPLLSSQTSSSTSSSTSLPTTTSTSSTTSSPITTLSTSSSTSSSLMSTSLLLSTITPSSKSSSTSAAAVSDTTVSSAPTNLVSESLTSIFYSISSLKTDAKFTPNATDTTNGIFNLLQSSVPGNVSDSPNVTDVVSNKTTLTTIETTKNSTYTTTMTVTFPNTTDDTSTSVTMTPTSVVTTSAASSSKVSSSAVSTSVVTTTKITTSSSSDPFTKTGSSTTSGSISVKTTSEAKITSTTDSSKGDKSKQSPESCGERETSFGKYGLAALAVVLVLCVIEFIIILILMTRVLKRRRQRQALADEKSVPKLKMLEIKDDATKRSTNDDLHVYSLDYEKHVQEKIEEHKKKVKPPVAEKPEKPIGGVSTFMLTKQLSLKSNVSSASSPDSPLSPAENKPLIKYHAGDDADEPVVFNFAKRPSEVLTKRRESNLDETRRKSNASAGKSKAAPKDKFDTDI